MSTPAIIITIALVPLLLGFYLGRYKFPKQKIQEYERFRSDLG